LEIAPRADEPIFTTALKMAGLEFVGMWAILY